MTTLLIVDDDERNLQPLEVLLGGSGYRVIAATNGAEALAKARQEPPDLIVSDILMPVMDGFALCREWQKDDRLEAIPFVFYSATYTEENDREFALSLGAKRFLVKPAKPEVFLQVVREVLQEASQAPTPLAPPPAGTSTRLPVAMPEEEETSFLRQYNETLVRKLEHKTQQLELTNRELEQDIARRRQAEAALGESREQLRGLLARLDRLREEERTRLAREVHDVLGQLLTGMKMDLDWCDRKLTQPPEGTLHQALREKLLGTAHLVDTLIGTVQRISRELRPSVLDNIGLSAAVRSEARQFQERTGVLCEVAASPADPEPPPDDATGVFRIYQEILTNVARHARATHVAVKLERIADGFRLEVLDNGCGIGPNVLSDPHSLGLLGMRERAAQMGGKIDIVSAPGRGTAVALTIPAKPAQGPSAPP